MGLLSKIIGGVTVEPIEAIGNVITGIFGKAGEKLSHTEVMARLAQQPGLAQAEINKIEAGSRHWFTANWRPSIGWTCSLALFWHYVAAPFVGIWIDDLPNVEIDALFELVLAMLGMATLRTVEKLQGRTK